MGLFGFLKKGRGARAGEDGERAPQPAAPLAAVVVVRQGMQLPSAYYVEEVLRGRLPEAAGDPAIHRRMLSQPRWFPNPDAVQSGAAAIARAYADELAIDPGSREVQVTAGPDGAKVLLVLLYKE